MVQTLIKHKHDNNSDDDDNDADYAGDVDISDDNDDDYQDHDCKYNEEDGIQWNTFLKLSIQQMIASQ